VTQGAIRALCFQVVTDPEFPVTAEAAGSSPVVPAILFSELEGMAAKIPTHNSTHSITAPSA